MSISDSTRFYYKGIKMKEQKYGTAQFEAEDKSIKVWLQLRNGVYFVKWNDGDEKEITEDYIKTITTNELYYISQLTTLIDELDEESQD